MKKFSGHKLHEFPTGHTHRNCQGRCHPLGRELATTYPSTANARYFRILIKAKQAGD